MSAGVAEDKRVVRNQVVTNERGFHLLKLITSGFVL